MTTGKTVIPTHHYLTLFTPEEYDDFYGIPKFTQEERSYFFTFSLGDQQLIDSRTTINDKFYCALCLGYFRAKHSLVDFTFDNVSEDCTYLIKTYFNEQKAVPLMPIDYTRIRIQNKILSHEKTVRWKKSHQVTINPLLMELIKRHPKTRPLTKALLHHLFQQNIALPAYSTLQRLISFTLNEEQKRLWEICETKLSTTDQQQLKSLLENDESMYPITSIKQDVKEFTYTELDKEIKKHGLLQPIFNMAHPILVESSLPKETIHYYGSLVNFYNVYKINRMPQFQALVLSHLLK